jgi:hypothetical protein
MDLATWMLGNQMFLFVLAGVVLLVVDVLLVALSLRRFRRTELTLD